SRHRLAAVDRRDPHGDRRGPEEARRPHAALRALAHHVSAQGARARLPDGSHVPVRSEEHTSELQSQSNLVCRLLLEKKNKSKTHTALDHVLMDSPNLVDVYVEVLDSYRSPVGIINGKQKPILSRVNCCSLHNHVVET